MWSLPVGLCWVGFAALLLCQQLLLCSHCQFFVGFVAEILECGRVQFVFMLVSYAKFEFASRQSFLCFRREVLNGRSHSCNCQYWQYGQNAACVHSCGYGLNPQVVFVRSKEDGEDIRDGVSKLLSDCFAFSIWGFPEVRV